MVGAGGEGGRERERERERGLGYASGGKSMEEDVAGDGGRFHQYRGTYRLVSGEVENDLSDMTVVCEWWCVLCVCFGGSVVCVV